MKLLLERFRALGVVFHAGDGPRQRRDMTPSFAFGPSGGACDIATRSVWMGDLEPFKVLHEAMHVLLAVPGIPLETQPEECKFLIPIEREYGKVLLGTKGYVDCIDWQEATGCSWQGKTDSLHFLDGYEKKSFWLRALRLGVELGVLDAEHRPTFTRPNWDALAPSDMRFLWSRHENWKRAQKRHENWKRAQKHADRRAALLFGPRPQLGGA